MVYNKYLEELDVSTYSTNFVEDDDKRAKDWEEERKIYGFDSRETWCLYYIFAEWLYSRLRMYLDTDGEKMQGCQYAYDGNIYSLHTMILDIILKTKYFLEREFCFESEEYYSEFEKAIEMFSMILPVLWIRKTTPAESVLAQERRDYTFDEREVYHLYDTFVEWLLPRLKMYDKVNIIDTEWDKFEIDHEILTLQDCIDRMILLCELYLKNKNIMMIIEILNIWKIVFPHMWW